MSTQLSTPQLSQITQLAVIQCIRQQDSSLAAVSGLLRAYDYGMCVHAEGGIDTMQLPRMMTGRMVSLILNADGIHSMMYRTTPVVFANSRTGTAPQDIAPAMDKLWDAIAGVRSGFTFADEWVQAFLAIHPYHDGNGRVAWILYNMLRDTMLTPTDLPDFGWD